MDTNKLPLIGEKFPTLMVHTTHGPKVIPDDYQGKWFVLFSHPADFTPVCTTEFVEFALNNENFQTLNTELIGLSVDQTFSHIKWIEWIKDRVKIEVPFPIISDSLGNVSRTLGMISPAKGANTVRAVFIVDDKGVIRTILYYPQEIGRNINEILRAIRALQTSSIYNVATPANWPYNAIIGDKVILPPPTSIADITKRLQEAKDNNYICYDWWFCAKDL